MRRSSLAAVVLACLALSGCTSAIPLIVSGPALVENSQRPVPSVPLEVADTGSGSGSVISAETMPNLPLTIDKSAMNAARVVYRSTQSGDGTQTEVSGSVFTPVGDAPDGGWPVISFGHGTTGIDTDCAPSIRRDLMGLGALAAGYTKSGYAVAITDYQGLGHDGVHPYLDNETAGYNIIDAVRALRHVFPDVSARWAAFGGSQGGGAVWAANELAAGYAPDLELVGSASLAPGANMVGLVDKALDGTLTSDQAPLLQWVLESIARAQPDFDLDQYRSGSAAQDWDALTACTQSGASARNDAVARIGDHDFAPATDGAADRLREILARFAVPRQVASAPMLVVYGDADTFIDVHWTDEALQKACALGDVITIDRQPGKGHADIDGDAVNQWIGERFAGDRAANDCD